MATKKARTGVSATQVRAVVQKMHKAGILNLDTSMRKVLDSTKSLQTGPNEHVTIGVLTHYAFILPIHGAANLESHVATNPATKNSALRQAERTVHKKS